MITNLGFGREGQLRIHPGKSEIGLISVPSKSDHPNFMNSRLKLKRVNFQHKTIKKLGGAKIVIFQNFTRIVPLVLLHGLENEHRVLYV